MSIIKVPMFSSTYTGNHSLQLVRAAGPVFQDTWAVVCFITSTDTWPQMDLNHSTS